MAIVYVKPLESVDLNHSPSLEMITCRWDTFSKQVVNMYLSSGLRDSRVRPRLLMIILVHLCCPVDRRPYDSCSQDDAKTSAASAVREPELMMMTF